MVPGSLPASFVRNVSGAFPQGQLWLNQLPQTVDACLGNWNLALAGDPFDLSYHYVVPVIMRDGAPAVLKLGVPSPGFSAEAEALLAFAGVGAVRLFHQDQAAGALLLERIIPGDTLATLRDETDAAAMAAQVMLQLWQAPLTGTTFPTLDRWTNGFQQLRTRFGGATGPLDPQLVALAEVMRMELLRTTGKSRLLHADLHHFNILHGGASRWVAIDPKGVKGDPAYEPASFLLNPDSATALNPDKQQARIATFASRLDLDAQRITRWAFVHAVLAAWWTIEDGGEDCSSSLGAARTLQSLIK